jgi:hypothetical protein
MTSMYLLLTSKKQRPDKQNIRKQAKMAVQMRQEDALFVLVGGKKVAGG